MQTPLVPEVAEEFAAEESALEEAEAAGKELALEEAPNRSPHPLALELKGAEARAGALMPLPLRPQRTMRGYW